MGLLAKERVLFVLIYLLCGPVYAGEALYHLSMVDYFSMKDQKEKSRNQDDFWFEAGYHPPQVVIDLLDDPGERTAHQYIQWNRERLARILAAQQAIDAAEAGFLAVNGGIP